MPTKLKNLKVKRVAFVDEGANPEAHMKFAKRKPETMPDQIDDGTMTVEEAKNLFQRFADFIGKAFKWNDNPVEVEKDAHTFDEVEATRKADEILYNQFFPMISAFSDSICSILYDAEKSGDDKKTLMQKSLSEFSEAFTEAAGSWAGGEVSNAVVVKSLDAVVSTRDRLNSLIEKANTGEDKSDPEDKPGDGKPNANDGKEGDDPPAVKKGVNDMKFNVEAMTAEERAQYEDLAKRFGTEDEGQNPTPADPTPAPAADPAPAPDDDVVKSMKKELEELRKFREAAEDREIMEVAKKYTLLGHKPEELAKSLKELKAAGGTAYDSMIAVLDSSLKAVEASGTFDEIGKRGGNSSGGDDAWAKITTAASEIMKSRQNLTWAEAVDEACIQHPDLVAEYEKSRR